MDIYSISIINFLFIHLIGGTVFLAGLVNFFEPIIPNFIIQFLKYGKHKHNGKPNEIINKLEIPKSWFKHFYVFAGCWSVGIFCLAIRLYIFGIPIPEFFIKFLDISCGYRRRVTNNSFVTLIALFLITLQCLRRFYETNFIQIFSSTCKINLIQYLVGYFHYYGVILIILSEAQGFVRNENGSMITKLTINSMELFSVLPFMSLFLFAWIQQYRTNLIFINLRKNDVGNVVTQKHLMPTGGYFDYVSSPHMFFEIVLYASLYGILYRNTSWLYVVVWVTCNQFENAWLTHQWYIKTFPNYPKSRKAIIPKLI